MLSSSMRMFLLFLLGFFLAPIGDICHILSDTIVYPSDTYRYYIFGILPYWVPFLFGGATVAIGVSHTFTDKLFDFKLFLRYGNLIPDKWWHVGAGLGLLIVMYSISGVVPYWVMMILLIYFLATLARGPYDLILMAATAFVGASVEVYLISQGFFSYNEEYRHMFGIPIWLPLLYALASIAVGNLARKLAQIDIMKECSALVKSVRG